MDPLSDLNALLNDTGNKEKHFADSFLAQISMAQVTAVIEDMKKKHGRFLGAARSADGFRLEFDKVKIPTEIHLDDAGKISGLQFGMPISTGDIASLISEIASLPGRSSVLVLSNGKIIGEHEPDKPLAVASTIKLAVLLALKREVQKGVLDWGDVVKLDPAWKSLQSGQLQDWPDHSPVTIATLANLMISISDNTATDALIRILGRDAIETITPRNSPLLTTREYFILDSKQHDVKRDTWRESENTVRLKMLDEISQDPLPGYDELGVATHDLVWQLTTRELHELLDETADVPSVSVNPGPAEPKEWKHVAYKGGSLAGVLNQSSRLVGHDGSIHHVIATWNNDAELNEEPFRIAYRGIISRLAQSSAAE